MTYWLILFETNSDFPAKPPLKLKISRAKYEYVLQLKDVDLDVPGEGSFTGQVNRVFSMFEKIAFIVIDVKRNRQSP